MATITTKNDLAARIDEKLNGLGTKLTKALAAINGRRRERTVSLRDALINVKTVAAGADHNWEHGGTVANAYTQAAVTTVVLAARVEGKIRIGFTLTNAKGVITPGRGWKSLQPWGWYEGRPKGDAAAKWAAWALEPDVLTLEDPEVDAILESLAD